MPELAPHTALVPSSGIRRIFRLASDLENVISLAVGEPDLPIAVHIANAAKRAWDDDETNYTANGGIAPLREAIVDKLARDNGIRVGVEQVWVTVGGTQALYQAMQLLLDPGDEILIPDPGYTTFTMAPRMLDAVPVAYSLLAEHGFLPTIDGLEQLVTEKTRVLVLNSPSNPLGTLLPEALIRELLAFARRHDLWIISDEVYEYFAWDVPHVSVASLDGDDRVFSVFSFSKTYAMTGIRVGYLVTPPGLDVILRAVQEATVGCVNTPAQYAALAAITGNQAPVAEAREHYQDNIRIATENLDERGIRYQPSRGSFYLWVDVSYASGGDVAAWAERFLFEQRVAVAPGDAFGPSGQGWIRLCLAASREDVLEGIRRLPDP